MKSFLLSLLLAFSWTAQSAAACLITTSQGKSKTDLQDPLGKLLLAADPCPTDVFMLRKLLRQSKMKLAPTLVANRGFHNPSQGSFSIFEIVTTTEPSNRSVTEGDFFFGHFTGVGPNNALIADQNPQKGSLMIEAFAIDPSKGFNNFYELIGNGTEGKWFYRGDSADILADTQMLHRQVDPARPQFGNRLRCSACHSGGGPIMKEIYTPHNDWWTTPRPLNFGGRQPDAMLAEIFSSLVSAEYLSTAVVEGQTKLERDSRYQRIKSQTSLQEQLRPLFCPVEVNFQSDLNSNPHNQARVFVPTEFFVDSRLIPAGLKQLVQYGLPIERSAYAAALTQLGSRFPEVALADADHAWLTPVKAKSDKLAVTALITRRVIDAEFAADVLAIDFKNPVFSQARCSLLKYLPATAHVNWGAFFAATLLKADFPAAIELFQNLTNAARNLKFHQSRVHTFLANCRQAIKEPANVLKMVELLDQKRNEIRASEISRNPLGQILEPGFRVIFPQINRPVPPAFLELSDLCQVRPRTSAR